MVYKIKSKPKMAKRFSYQTGSRKSLRADRLRRAMPSGRRISRTGRAYTETRRNRSDITVKKRI